MAFRSLIRIFAPCYSSMRVKMKKYSAILLLLSVFLASCGEYAKVQKTEDYEYKYETAKAYYVDGHYSRASQLFGDMLAVMKGTSYGEECLYLLATSTFNCKDYESAASYFRKYYQSYPKGLYVEYAHYYSGLALYRQTPDSRLDQATTKEAINELQSFLDAYPETNLKDVTQEMIYTLQDKLVEKEFLSAKLYYDLGTYVNNCAYGGNNYEACVVTSQNALKDYPYATAARREEFSIMILKSKYHLARQSVEDRRIGRYREVIDEYSAFVNDFPESKYLKDAQEIFRVSDAIVKNSNVTEDDLSVVIQ